MSNENFQTQTHEQALAKIDHVLVNGDLSQLQPKERIDYYRMVCESSGLNPITRPFEFMRLNGKTVLYAKKECTDQLRAVNKISIEIKSRERIGDVYVVTASAKNPAGRCDESTGAMYVANLKGDALANAYLKAETKAKRRVTLSIVGLGCLDESEVECIPNVEYIDHETGEYIKNQEANEPVKQKTAPTYQQKPMVTPYPLVKDIQSLIEYYNKDAKLSAYELTHCWDGNTKKEVAKKIKPEVLSWLKNLSANPPPAKHTPADYLLA